MTGRTRYFLLSSSMILIIGLCAGLIAYYGGFPEIGFSRAVGPQELQYVPDDASVVAYANVRDVMDSDFRERVRKIDPHGQKGRQEFQEKTGIDIEHDVDHVVGCLGRANGSSEKQGMALVRGRFDQARIEGMLRQRGGRLEQYKGKRVLTHPDRDGEGAALAFMEADLLALGSRQMVRRAIELGEGGPNVTANAELMRIVRDLDHGDAWAVGRFDVLVSQARFPEGVARRMPPITWFAARGDVNGGVSGTIKAEARDEEAANNLRDLIRGFIALARLQVDSRKPEMQAMMQAIQLGGSGKTVELSFSVPPQVLDFMVPRARQIDKDTR